MDKLAQGSGFGLIGRHGPGLTPFLPLGVADIGADAAG